MSGYSDQAWEEGYSAGYHEGSTSTEVEMARRLVVYLGYMYGNYAIREQYPFDARLYHMCNTYWGELEEARKVLDRLLGCNV